MKKALLVFLSVIQIFSLSGCVYSNNYDENGQDMNKEQVLDAVDDIKESITDQIGSAVSEQSED